MAAQTLRIYESPLEDSYVDLIYDDAALTCSSAHVHVGAAARASLVSTLVIGGQPFTQSFPPGTDTDFPLPVTLTITIGTGRSGQRSLDFGIDSVSFGFGS